jgi:MFS transporter, FHS family, L-fucose permease
MHQGNTGMSMLYVTLFFESVCFPTIVALGMRGLGRHTKRGSGFIVGGVLGGAVVPPILGATADAQGTAMAMVVPLCFFILAWTYALAVNFWPWYRNTVDAFTVVEVGLHGHHEGVADLETGDVVKAARSEEEDPAVEQKEESAAAREVVA